MKIAIAEIGFVGLPNVILPAHHSRRIKTKGIEIIGYAPALAEHKVYTRDLLGNG